jgi:hypothetical protein
VNIFRKFIAVAVACLVMTAAGVAGAATFTGTWSVHANTADPGLVVKTNPGSGSFSHNLNVGDSVTFKLFRLWTDETWVNADDKVAKPIKVAFDFTSPFSFGGEVAGTTVGTSSIFGIIQRGKVDWSGPVSLAFGPEDSGRLTLSLFDASFNKGVFGLTPGYKKGADIYARLTYDVAPIPVPAALPLLLGGLGLLGFAARRRATA